jgi:hypothetical protein
MNVMSILFGLWSSSSRYFPLCSLQFLFLLITFSLQNCQTVEVCLHLSLFQVMNTPIVWNVNDIYRLIEKVKMKHHNFDIFLFSFTNVFHPISLLDCSSPPWIEHTRKHESRSSPFGQKMAISSSLTIEWHLSLNKSNGSYFNKIINQFFYNKKIENVSFPSLPWRFIISLLAFFPSPAVVICHRSSVLRRVPDLLFCHIPITSFCLLRCSGCCFAC